MIIPTADRKAIAVRGSTARPRTVRMGDSPEALCPSSYTLTFDVETTTDTMQSTRVGCFHVRDAATVIERGLFYDPDALAPGELTVLTAYAEVRGFTLRTLREFVDEVFFLYISDLRGTCVSFNLPFDLSRLALSSARARSRTFTGGFTLKLSEDGQRPRIQIKHLTNRSAIIQLTAPARQRTPRGMRRRKMRVPPHRGYFVDVRTFAGALVGRSWTLEALTDHLKTEHRKRHSEAHGSVLTEEYLDYATNDVQATWECYQGQRI